MLHDLLDAFSVVARKIPRATLLLFGASCAWLPAQVPSTGVRRPYLDFYEPAAQAQLEERVARAIRDLGDERASQRDFAVRELVLIGQPAVEPLRAAVEDRQDEVRRAALRALVALAPTPETFEAVERLASTIERSFEVPFFAMVLLGEPQGSEADRRERAERLGILARQPKASLAIPALLALLRLGETPPNVHELSALLGRSGDPVQEGIQALTLGRLHPGSAPVLAAYQDRPRPEFTRACVYWASSFVGGGKGVPGLPAEEDLSARSSLLASCAALQAIPRTPQEVTALRDRVLDGDVSEPVREGLVTALALANCEGVHDALVDIASSASRREGLRDVLMQAAVRRSDEVLLRHVAASLPPIPELETKLFAAACGVLTNRVEAIPPVLLPEPSLEPYEALIEKARARLREGPLLGAREAATFLLLVGAEGPGDVDPVVAADSDSLFLARLSRLARERKGDVDQKTLRRLGLAVAIEHQVDAEGYRDRLLHELLWTALGRNEQPFALVGLNDLPVPDGAANFPAAHHGAFYEDLRFFLEARPFRTVLERALRGGR